MDQWNLIWTRLLGIFKPQSKDNFAKTFAFFKTKCTFFGVGYVGWGVYTLLIVPTTIMCRNRKFGFILPRKKMKKMKKKKNWWKSRWIFSFFVFFFLSFLDDFFFQSCFRWVIFTQDTLSFVLSQNFVQRIGWLKFCLVKKLFWRFELLDFCLIFSGVSKVNTTV